jgi:hypothetical protein
MPGLEQSETDKVSGSQFMRWSPGYANDWHPARQRQYHLITLSGRGELELAGGQWINSEGAARQSSSVGIPFSLPADNPARTDNWPYSESRVAIFRDPRILRVAPQIDS